MAWYASHCAIEKDNNGGWTRTTVHTVLEPCLPLRHLVVGAVAEGVGGATPYVLRVRVARRACVGGAGHVVAQEGEGGGRREEEEFI